MQPPVQEATARLRRAQPLLEIRIPFEIDRREIEALARGARNPELDPVVTAARQAALIDGPLVYTDS